MEDVEKRDSAAASKPSFVGPICLFVLAAVSAVVGRVIANSMKSTSGGLLGAVENANRRTDVMATFDIIGAGLAVFGVVLLVRTVIARKRV